MLSNNFRKLSQQEEQRLGLPPGIKFATPFPFSGMNQAESRIGMKDQEFFYIEKFIKLGDGNLRTLWDKGTALYTAPMGKTIVSFFFYNINVNNYVIVFLSDGTAIQVNTSTGAQTTVSSMASTFYNGNFLPGCAQWGDQYLIIGNNITANSYWLWDGSLLYTAGGLSPNIVVTSGGSGYSSAPSVAAFGGSGSGATFTAVVSQGSVTGVQITNPGSGYEPGDIVQLVFSGGGSDSSAYLAASITAGAIQSVVITNPGTGYSPGTYALGFSGGSGSGAAGTYTVGAGGTVDSAIITSGGSGYVGSPTVSFPSGGGSSAAGIAVISPGSVTSVAVIAGGSGFTGTPTISFEGGGGSGAAGTVVLSGGAISSVTVTNGGSGYTSQPAVVIQTGLNQAASADVTLMPYGVSGTSIETYQSRVWICSPFQTGTRPTRGVFNVSAPGSLNDFATSSGGLQFDSTDSFLRYEYSNIKQSNGYLYPFGDSSISVISNVQTSGSPATTVFNYQNTDPQIGTSWRDSVSAFSLTLLFGNALGIFGLYGGVVRKVSRNMDNLFINAIFPPTVGGLTPSSAVANIFSKKVYFLLMTFKDPFTQQTVNKMVGWDERDWLIASQSLNLIYIGTQEVSSNLFAWGTDGTALYPLFTTPSASLSKVLSTKLYGTDAAVIAKRAYTFSAQAQDLSSAQSGINLNINIDTNFQNPDTGKYTYALPTPISFAPGTAGVPTIPMSTTWSGDVYGMNIGATITSTSPDFALNFLGIGYVDDHAELAQAEG